VKVFSGRDLSLINDFLPFSPSVTNGVNVYVADGTGAGELDIFVALKSGYPSLVGFNGRTGQPLAAVSGSGGDGTYSGIDNVSGGDSSNSYYYYSGNDGSYPPYTPPDTGGDTGSTDSGSGSTDSGSGSTDNSGDGSGCGCGDSGGYSGGDTSGDSGGYSGGDSGNNDPSNPDS
jgi:hypothetical protein